MNTRYIAIITGPDTYLDHVGVLCSLMDIPLIVTEEETYQAACKFYPQIQVSQKNLSELSSGFLAHHFDVIFESGKFWKTELDSLFKILHKKTMRFVFCPHGNSDKGHSATKHVDQDLSLVYGQHMLDLLEHTGALKSISHTVKTGNYRLLFYKKYQSFYDDIVKAEVMPKLDSAKKTILYAPTWQDGENPSSFFHGTQKLIEELSPNFNIIIKLHPFLEQFHPAQTYYVLQQYEKAPGVLFLQKFPAIYPLLTLCDLYIGDYSSIGYDFLAFDKPLYFLTEPKPSQLGSFLHRCGKVLPVEGSLSTFIQNTWIENSIEKSKIRKETYLYAFGEEKPFSLVKEEILAVLEKEKSLT